MVNYLRAEFFKLTRRKYTYGFLLTLVAGAAALVAIWMYADMRGSALSFDNGVSILGNMLTMGFYLVIVTGDLAFSDQYKHNTLKNEVSYGVPRVRIYLGKLVVACVMAIVACAVVIGFYLGLCRVVLVPGPADGEALKGLGQFILALLPRWLGAQALAIFFYFSFRSSAGASMAFVGVLALLPEVFKVLAYFVDPIFANVRPFLLMGGSEAMWQNWAIGLGWFAVSTVLGLILFQKREIN